MFCLNSRSSDSVGDHQEAMFYEISTTSIKANYRLPVIIQCTLSEGLSSQPAHLSEKVTRKLFYTIFAATYCYFLVGTVYYF